MIGYTDSMLAVGTSVDIQRTDGRVHSAIVSGINATTHSVTVEWYEKGEAKGKEIELEAIYQMNPALRKTTPTPDVSGTGDTTRIYPHAAPSKEHGPNPLRASTVASSHETRGSVPVLPTVPIAPEPLLLPPPPPPPPAAAPIRLPASRVGNGVAAGAAAAVAPVQSRVVQSRPTIMAAADVHSIGPTRAGVHSTTLTTVGGADTRYQDNDYSESNTHGLMEQDGLDNLADFARDPDTGSLQAADWLDADGNDYGMEDTTTSGPTRAGTISEQQRRAIGRTNSTVTGSFPPATGAAGGSSNSLRKSNCVSEIERIQQRREVRRAAQRAVRDQVELDPKSPSYEFQMMILDYRSTLDYRPLTNSDPIEDHQISVCVRKRPMNKKELGRREIDVVTVPNKQLVVVHEPRSKVDLTKYLENQQFRYDYTFDDTTDNELVYRYTAKPLVECIFERGMATCFAYGQTGSGKTHTMGGEFHGRGQQDCTNGIYALAAQDVFDLNATKYAHEQLRVDAVFFEIYSGKVFDLLNKKEKLRVLEDAKGQVQIIGLREEHVASVEAVLQLLKHGQHIRTSGQTSANQHSSRSHAVFQLILKRPQTNRIHGKFSLIDLAGNERGVDTSSSDRHTRMEGAEINKSLLALKECIRALGRKGGHLPFRASKLTQVLRDSFIGDRSRTCMIAMISPGMASCEHTLNTLRYADRVKELGPSGMASAVSNTDLPPITARNGPTSTNRPGTAGGYGDVNGSSVSGSGLLSTTLRAPGYPNQQPSAAANWNGHGVGGANASLRSGQAEEDDLAMLRSVNDGEVTDDLLTFQEVVSQIERMEEEVCDDHRALCKSMSEWTKEHFRLHKASNQVEFDVEEKVSAWRRELRQEEELSSKLQRGVRL